jgi:hypothetical protein
MGTETTSAAYRRTQNPRVTKFFYGITGIQRNRQQTFVTAKLFLFFFTYFLIANRKKCLHKFKKYVILLQAIEYG